MIFAVDAEILRKGGVLLSCLSYMERLSVCIYRIYEKLSSLSKNLRIW